MHMLCKYDFVRFIVDLFVGLFNCLNFSLELCVCVCVCVRACVRACLSPSLSSIFFLFPNIFHFCYVYKLFLLKTI